ncbi:hypothetical protein CRQ31_05595 [Salmonella enterica subsp. enterica serovar Worthington]|uniref:Uncharacterized protein n=1 Tax=Salmonella enterica subsp. enterica serovar Ank TaxID=1173578 RepID=A0A5I2X778_SALET|nr:hypothetical protein [Salmonella enterica]EBS1326924.1 hypothetical protein [Salmonella enterica subsp. enterica serovar Muenchen]EBY9282882.1 hypothetical protein [Salmonella enterica subsp. enterica serovar Denver]ECF3885277.1 hypothetical protein [Salmonella enterica subsp. enterica serovar Ank]EGI5051723.1 hypothetical protein [Salmonella enterica subsp. enterica serovar Worthington]ECD5428003.1 hypothetical protein [Salmonella enterica subsp. enterica serovar Denver]
MQKIILVFLLLFTMNGRFVYATTEPTINIASVNENEANIQQEELVDIMKDNFSFEKEKRQLVNELALEKLKNELKKLRGTAIPTDMPVMTESTISHTEVTHPYVVLVSKIGGLTRILVSAEGHKHYLSAGDIFSSGGKEYILTMDSMGKYLVKEKK